MALAGGDGTFVTHTYPFRPAVDDQRLGVPSAELSLRLRFH